MLRPDAERRRVQLQQNRESMMFPSLHSRPVSAALGGVDPDGGI
jgi:hypothetical protein